MEFLIARGFEPRQSPDLLHRLAQNTTCKPEQEAFTLSLDSFFVFSTQPPVVDDPAIGEHYLFDGHFFYKDSFFHPFLPANSAKLETVFEALEAGAYSDVSGVFCLARLDLRRGQFSLYCDPLSQYPVASWEDGGQYLVSNNVLLIEQFLAHHGKPLKRNPVCMLHNNISVMNLSGTTPYYGVSFQAPRTMLHGEKTLERRKLYDWNYLCWAPGSYQECIQAAADSLKQKCRAVVASLPEAYLLADITGGIDSRLVLAALLASGVQDKVRMWTNYRYPHPDGNVAHHIIHKYGLRQGSILINRVHEDFSIEEQIRRGLFRNRGARYKDWSGLGKAYFPNQIRFSGSFGEIGRSNVFAAVFDNARYGINKFRDGVRHHLDRVGSLEMISKPGIELMIEPVHNSVQAMVDMGVARGSMSDMLYLDGRGRYHFGHQFACNTMLFVNPCLIYDMNLVWANMHLSMSERIAGKAQFDLIRLLAGDELASLPMADKRWSADIIPADLEALYSAVKPVSRDSSELPHGPNLMKWVEPWPPKKRAQVWGQPIPEWARGRGPEWRQFPEYQRLAGELLAQTEGTEEFFRYVDRKKLLKMSKRNPARIEQDWWIWGLQIVVAGLMWHLGLEDRTQLSVPYQYNPDEN